MSEAFLHFIWQYQYFNSHNFKTCTGEDVLVFYPGTKNLDAGPDFLNARLKIAGIEWIGSVEIHIDSSGWIDHKHDLDEGYDNVILHVVWRNDCDVFRRDNTLLPTLEINTLVDHDLVFKYKALLNSIDVIPCASSLSSVSPLLMYNTLDRMLMHRLEIKAREVLQVVSRNKGNWEESAYQLLARNYGFKVNADPFTQLAQSLPLKILLKHADKLLQVEAMLFGVAGFLEEDAYDSYYKLLQREYNMLRQKYRLDHYMMKKVQWKFLRLRPANFPTLRLAQFASYVSERRNFFSYLLSSPFTELQQSFYTQPSEYWQRHYNFSGLSVTKEASMGRSSVENILINTVVPIYAAYSLYKDDQVYMDKALSILQALPSESNKVIVQWNSLSVKSKNAFDSQALIELNNNFCSRRRCLDCNIGASLVKPARM